MRNFSPSPAPIRSHTRASRAELRSEWVHRMPNSDTHMRWILIDAHALAFERTPFTSPPLSIVCLLGCVVSSKTDYPTYARDMSLVCRQCALLIVCPYSEESSLLHASVSPRPVSCALRLGYGISMVVFGLVALVLLGSPRESENNINFERVRRRISVEHVVSGNAICLIMMNEAVDMHDGCEDPATSRFGAWLHRSCRSPPLTRRSSFLFSPLATHTRTHTCTKN